MKPWERRKHAVRRVLALVDDEGLVLPAEVWGVIRMFCDLHLKEEWFEWCLNRAAEGRGLGDKR